MNATPDLMHTTSTLTFADHWDHFLARWGYRRGDHRVTPGLYALGHPTMESPVFVTANYTLSFDALRSSLPGVDGYILVLDTMGINVWCAAGKGTFGTDEIVQRVEAAYLSDIVSHRTLILPQLGAPGVAAHEVKQRTGFKVEYGPVRAADLLEYLKTHQATPEMRQVRFPLRDRLVLIPVELVHLAKPTALVLAVLMGPLAAAGAVAAVLTGAALFPILLPWLPTGDFSSKGFILGGLTALPFALASRKRREGRGWPLAYMLSLPPVTAFLALNFTGATPFTSKTGVKREMFKYIRVMAGMFGAGVLLALVLRLTRRAK
ncbi:MAG: mercury methylation corrinoid protein HgcA [Anaerolineae bacterium]